MRRKIPHFFYHWTPALLPKGSGAGNLSKNRPTQISKMELPTHPFIMMLMLLILLMMMLMLTLMLMLMLMLMLKLKMP